LEYFRLSSLVEAAARFLFAIAGRLSREVVVSKPDVHAQDQSKEGDRSVRRKNLFIEITN
jgi:hypothetical protein